MSFASDLRAEIAATPIPLADFMARCNAHYYGSRDPFGSAGDFTTAPEISQLFGELVGAWLVDRWQHAGSPVPSRLVELGPGRGTLMVDIVRVAAAAGWRPEIVFVESSVTLLVTSLRSHRGATGRVDVTQIPEDAVSFFVANEFFDALPVRQVERRGTWHERLVIATSAGLATTAAAGDATAIVPRALRGAPAGTIVEVSPAAAAIAAEIGRRLRASGGAALIVDYGHVGPATGDTLQAVRGHAPADPFAAPGDADLTCHVDFTALAVAAGVRAWGPAGQGDFLRRLGIDARAARLKAAATPAQAAAIDAAVTRLTSPAAMGDLFKVMALTAGGEKPPGFA